MSVNQTKRGRAVLSAFLATLLVPILCPEFAYADDMLDFQVSRGSLSSVINQLAMVSHKPIAFSPSLSSGVEVGPVTGHMTLRSALSQALAGTGLTLVSGAGGGFTIRAPSAKTQAAAGAGGATDIDDIDVSGFSSPHGDDGFQAGDAGVVTRIQAPIREIPLSVTAITSDVLQSQAIVNVGDAAQNVAGVVVQPGAVGAPLFQIRGFESNNTGPSVNGALTGTYATVPIDDIDRLEVLKGPTSILTGVTQEGGIVNLTTKTPTDRTIRDVTVRFGSFGYKTLAFDLGGIVPQTEGLTYRFNISGNIADTSYAGYASPHENLISPALRWQDRDTSVTVGIRYYDTKAGQAPQTTFDNNNNIIPIARGVPQGGSYFSYTTKDIDYYSEISHNFGTFYGIDVSAHNSLSYDTQRVNAPLSQLGYFTGNTPSEAIFYSANITQLVAITTERADITLKNDVGFLRQTARFGFDFIDYNLQYGQSYVADPPNFGLFPVNLSTGYPTFPTGTAPSTGNDETRTITPGFSFTDKIDTFDNRLHILGSVREDHFRTIGHDNFGDREDEGQYGLSWTAGGAFDVAPWLTVYGHRNMGFSAQAGVAENGMPLPPQGRDQSEVGARFYLFDKRLNITTSVYQLAQTNIAIANAINPLVETLIAGQESKGFEFEAQGQIAPGLNVIASFADQNSHYIDPTYNGGTVGGTPQFTGSLWAVYELQNGPLRGLSFGAGAQGTSKATESTTYITTAPAVIPGYVIANAAIGYRRDKYDFNLKINNVFDKTYYYSSAFIGSQPVIVGEGRNFLLVAKYHF